MKCERLKQFCQETYQLLGKAHDATFELMDSVMTTTQVSHLLAIGIRQPVPKARSVILSPGGA